MHIVNPFDVASFWTWPIISILIQIWQYVTSYLALVVASLFYFDNWEWL